MVAAKEPEHADLYEEGAKGRIRERGTLSGLHSWLPSTNLDLVRSPYDHPATGAGTLFLTVTGNSARSTRSQTLLSSAADSTDLVDRTSFSRWRTASLSFTGCTWRTSKT